jgi:hypothetical protein
MSVPVLSDLDFGGAARLLALPNPTLAQEAATKAYVDAVAGGAVSAIVTLDFGAFPGSLQASLAVTGQTGVLSTSRVKAWVVPVATADHSLDEHILEDVRAFAHTIVPGVGFTVTLVSATRTYGLWSVAYEWSM